MKGCILLFLSTPARGPGRNVQEVVTEKSYIFKGIANVFYICYSVFFTIYIHTHLFLEISFNHNIIGNKMVFFLKFEVHQNIRRKFMQHFQ